MTFDTRKVGLYGTTGVLIATLIIASLAILGGAIPGLRLPSFVSNKGTLTIMIMDAPTELKHLNVTIDSLRIQRVEDDTETWVDLEFIGGVSEVYFDLLALRNVAMDLSETEIPTGNYTMIKMHVKTANATYLDDGGTVDLTVPSDVIKVVLKPHLQMESEGSITVLIDLQPENYKSIAISHSLNLRPVIKAIIND